jgi:hypothetical protein
MPVNGDMCEEVSGGCRDVLIFTEHEGLLHLPGQDMSVALLVMTLSLEQKQLS